MCEFFLQISSPSKNFKEKQLLLCFDRVSIPLKLLSIFI